MFLLLDFMRKVILVVGAGAVVGLLFIFFERHVKDYKIRLKTIQYDL